MCPCHVPLVAQIRTWVHPATYTITPKSIILYLCQLEFPKLKFS